MIKYAKNLFHRTVVDMRPVPSAPEVMINISEIAYDKMKYIVELTPTEIGWHTMVERNSKYEFTITDVILPKQVVNGATCEILPEGFASEINKLYTKDKGIDENWRQNGRDRIAKVRGWFHSHVNFGVNPSGQDHVRFSELCNNSEFYIRGIMNKKGEMKLDLYIKEDFMIIEDVPFSINKIEVQPPILSEMSGIKKDEFELCMRADPDSKIYYTTNGEKPTITDNLYIFPITISDDALIRAIAIDGNNNKSEITKGIYEFQEINIVKDQILAEIAEKVSTKTGKEPTKFNGMHLKPETVYGQDGLVRISDQDKFFNFAETEDDENFTGIIYDEYDEYEEEEKHKIKPFKNRPWWKTGGKNGN